MEWVLLAIVTVFGLGVYVVVESGSPLPKLTPKPRTPRDDLFDARDSLRRQIEIMECRAQDFRRNVKNPWSEDTLETLRAELRAVEDKLGPGA
jgi:hypothetical protein